MYDMRAVLSDKILSLQDQDSDHERNFTSDQHWAFPYSKFLQSRAFNTQLPVLILVRVLRLDVVTDWPRRAAFREVPNGATNRFAINLGHRARSRALLQRRTCQMDDKWMTRGSMRSSLYVRNSTDAIRKDD